MRFSGKLSEEIFKLFYKKKTAEYSVLMKDSL